MTLDDVQGAIVSWVQTAAAKVNPAITASQIVWEGAAVGGAAGSSASAPEGAFIKLRMGDMLVLGARDEEQTALVPNWLTGTNYKIGDEVIDAQMPSVLWQCTTAGNGPSTVSPSAGGEDGYAWASLGPSLGQEIQITEFERDQFTLSVQCFGTIGQEAGALSPPQVLQAVRHALQLPSVRDALSEVGVSCYDRGSVRNVASLAGTIYEPRAIFESSWYINAVQSDQASYIERVEATGTITANVPGSPIDTTNIIDLP